MNLKRLILDLGISERIELLLGAEAEGLFFNEIEDDGDPKDAEIFLEWVAREVGSERLAV